MVNGFAGKVGVVTGAAGGIGAATASAFAQLGAHVVMIDTNDQAGMELCTALDADGLAAEYENCDVTSADAVATLFERLSARHGCLDFAANLVGGSGKGDTRTVEFHEQDEAGWDATLTLSLRSALLCMKHEIAAMLRSGGGAIVNVSSMAALHVTLNATPAYSAAKAALLHLTRYTAVAYADRGIRVNCVAPGLTATPGAIAALGEAAIADEVARNQCIPHAAVPADQANAVVWLCSDAAAMVTGHTVPVDGGWNAR